LRPIPRRLCVERVIEHAKLAGEREDLSLRMTGASALWSLASNAHSPPVVRESIERAVAGGRDDLAEVLTADPDTFRRRMAAG
jgi:hypothetical protein